jgi:hypothetical protein
MATTKQVKAARRNVKQAQRTASKKRTIANLPKSTRSELGKQAAGTQPRWRGRPRARGPQTGSRL